MRDELVALAQLAKMDASARDLDRELREIPARIESMADDAKMLETMLGREREMVADFRELRTRQADAVQTRVDGMARARTKLSQAQNAKEADAAQREIESIRRALKEREAKLSELDGGLGTKEGALTKRETEFAEAQSMLDAERAASDQRIAELKAKRDEVLAGRAAVVAKINGRTVKRYERLRTKFDDALVVVDDGNCKGCRMALPAQLFIEMQRGEGVTDCPQCRRLVIYSGMLREAGAYDLLDETPEADDAAGDSADG